jgi:hypothetical protein
MQPDIKTMLGNAGTPEENPLEKISEASKNASKKPEVPKGQAGNFDEETLKQILMTGENSEGLFTPNEDKEEEEKDPKHAEVDEDAKFKQGKIGKPHGKYANKFREDVAKNPQNYKVQTPKGEMTIAEAMRKGYNPITKRFEHNKDSDLIKEKHLSGLNEADRAKLEELTNPSSAHIAPKDAANMGLPENSPMIDGAVPPQAQGGQAPQEPGDLASMLGGIE